MSYSAVVDLVLHFHSFRNIDLFHQGLYNLRVCVYQDLSDSATEGQGVTSQSSNGNPRSNCVAAYPYAILPAKFVESDFSPTPTLSDSPNISHHPPPFQPVVGGRSPALHWQPTPSQSLTPPPGGGRKVKKVVSRTERILYPAEINDEAQSFTTRTFIVRFREEETELNELCHFRFEVDLCRPNGLSAPVYMEVDLMYAEPASSASVLGSLRSPSTEQQKRQQQESSPSSSSNRPDASGATSDSAGNRRTEGTGDAKRAALGDDLFSSPVADVSRSPSVSDTEERLPRLKFNSVSYQTYQIENVAFGVHEYVPVIFDEFHYSLVSLTVHSVLQDIRCRLRPNTFPTAYQPRHRLRKPSPTLTYSHSPPRKDSQSDSASKPSPPPSPAKPAVEPTLPRSFTEFLHHGHRALRNHNESRVRISSSQKSSKALKHRRRSSSAEGDTNEIKRVSSLPLIEIPVAVTPPTTCMSSTTVSTAVDDDPPIALSSPSPSTTSPAASSSSHLHSALIERADILHSEYIGVLLESLLRVISVYRCFSYRGLASKQRSLLGSSLDIKPIQLPGGAVVILPGTANAFAAANPSAAAAAKPLLKRASTSPRRAGTKSSQSNGSQKIFKEFRHLASSSATPKGSGSSYYTEDDLMTVTFHLAPEAVEEEIERFEDERSEETQQLRKKPSRKNSADSINAPIDIRAKIPQLSARLNSNEPSAMAAIMTQDFQLLATQIVELWHRLICLLPTISAEIEVILRALYDRRITDRWKESIFRETCKTADVSLPSEKAVWETHQKVAEHLRRSNHFLSLEPLPATELFFFPPRDQQPILFEQRYVREDELLGQSVIEVARRFSALPTSISRSCRALSSSSKNNRGLHLFVLVHGFQGNSCDMRLFKNNITAIYPSAMVLCSTANEDDTEGSIENMGLKLAVEVIRYVEDTCPGDTMSRISFICHSLGGVIARSAFKNLKALWPKLYTFMSLSSPHLGYMYNANKLVDAGMWFLKKWKKSQSLLELTLCDAKSVRESFLFNLALKSEPLGYFENVCLVSSYQDQYVPFESARMEISGRAESDARLGPVYAEMARNAVRVIQPERLIRLDVNFKITEKTLDTFIGRSAHIMFLENQVVMRMLVHAYPQLFC